MREAINGAEWRNMPTPRLREIVGLGTAEVQETFTAM